MAAQRYPNFMEIFMREATAQETFLGAFSEKKQREGAGGRKRNLTQENFHCAEFVCRAERALECVKYCF